MSDNARDMLTYGALYDLSSWELAGCAVRLRSRLALAEKAVKAAREYVDNVASGGLFDALCAAIAEYDGREDAEQG